MSPTYQPTPADVPRTVQAANEAGQCVLPPKEDGRKKPETCQDGSWKKWQEALTTSRELIQFYANGRTGVGLFCEKMSGNEDRG